MRLIQDKSINLILADLPYEETQNVWDSVITPEIMWNEYKRIIKDNGVIALTASFQFASKIYESRKVPFRYDIVWRKNKSTGFLNAKKMPLRQHELILLFYRKLPVYNPQKTTGHKPANSYTKHTGDGSNYGKTKIGVSGGGQTDRYPTSVWDIPVMNNDSKDKWHPTQKPVELFERIIKTYSNQGDLVLDNASGSGTTAEACMNTQRDYICFEKDRTYWEKSIARIHRLNNNT
jgi:site-specific DNA-methyltransferase (adenine-specific)